MIQDKGIIERRQLKRMAADEFRMYMFSFPKEDEYEVLNLLLMSNAQIMLIDINTPEELQKIDIKEVSCTKRTVMAVLRRLVRDDSEVFKPLKEVCVYAAIALPNNNNDDMLYKNYLYLRLKNVFKSFHVYAYSVYCNRVVLRMRSNVQSGILMESGKQHCTSVNALNYVVMPFLGLGDFFMQFSCIYEFARTRPNHVYLAEVRRNGDKRLLYYSDVVKYLSFSCGNQFLDFEKIASNIKTISLCAYRLASANHKIYGKSQEWYAQYGNIEAAQRSNTPNKGAFSHGSCRENHICRISQSFCNRSRLQRISVPNTFPRGLCLPEMRMHGILPHPNQTHLSVQKLPETNLCDRWYSHAPHTSAADRLVLGDLPLCNR